MTLGTKSVVIDNGFWKPTSSYFEHVVQHGNYYPKHAFSTGQIASKSWLLKELYSRNNDENILKQSKGITEKELYSVIPNVAILGSWIGTLVGPCIRLLTLKEFTA